MSKVCSTCKKAKELTEFNRDRVNPDGLQYRCKVCRSERRFADRERLKEYNRKWRSENKANVKGWRARYTAKSPEKKLARNVLYRAVRSGNLQGRSEDNGHSTR